MTSTCGVTRRCRPPGWPPRGPGCAPRTFVHAVAGTVRNRGPDTPPDAGRDRRFGSAASTATPARPPFRVERRIGNRPSSSKSSTSSPIASPMRSPFNANAQDQAVGCQPRTVQRPRGSCTCPRLSARGDDPLELQGLRPHVVGALGRKYYCSQSRMDSWPPLPAGRDSTQHVAVLVRSPRCHRAVCTAFHRIEVRAPGTTATRRTGSFTRYVHRAHPTRRSHSANRR